MITDPPRKVTPTMLTIGNTPTMLHIGNTPTML